jgi:hypothetical protein
MVLIRKSIYKIITEATILYCVDHAISVCGICSVEIGRSISTNFVVLRALS